ncbi:MAG TPA: ABC transporter substrate-binding protein, partial [Fimbriimonadaceae bacterium]|nr:ABC transporter substrate-binding protein [Fimbriimonadaceae bacterium]
YVATMLGAHFFWPYPQHILQDAYDKYQASKDANDILGLPYWTSGYINDGPFRVTEFSPGDSVTLQAYDGFFFGRPKVDVIRIKTFGTENALFSSILAGAIDVYMPVAMSPNLGFELQQQWQAPGNGTVYLVSGNVRFLSPQARPDFQKEPAVLDVRVRQGLYYALDREALASALEGGHADLAAYGFLSPQNPNYPAIKDDLRAYAYDPNRAKATLQDAGWKYNPDGSLVNATDGRRFSTSLWSTQGSDEEIGAIADYWRQVGLAVDEFIIPATFTRNEEYRASFPGWETTANADDTILSRLEPPSGPATHWAGTNRAGWDDPVGRTLIAAYRQALTPQAQVQASKALSDYVVSQLPFMPFVYQADHTGVRKGVKALDDAAGGALAGAPYGNYTRNAYLWDLE